MNTWGIFAQILALALAVLAGQSLARQGVLTGRAAGAFDVRVWRWRIVWKSLQIRPDKAYFQCVLLAA